MNKSTTWQSTDCFKEALKAKGLKATAQRTAVHRAMMQLGHASADEVLEHLRENDPQSKVTVASVYNFLPQMVDLGIYAIRLGPSSKMYYDVNPTPHAHLYDTKNGKYMDVMSEDILQSVRQALSHHRFKGYRVSDVDVTIKCIPTRKKITQ